MKFSATAAFVLCTGAALAQVGPSTGATAAGAASAPAAVATNQQLPPEELFNYGANWQMRGTGALRFFGFKVYDASLWLPQSGAPFDFKRPFALDIRYSTGVKGTDIANTSLIEMQRISPSSPEQITRWSKLLNDFFVDVKAGDRLVGVHVPGAGVRFFLNGKLIGETADIAFSEAFFRIWLDAKTKRPELRTALLAGGPEAR